MYTEKALVNKNMETPGISPIARYRLSRKIIRVTLKNNPHFSKPTLKNSTLFFQLLFKNTLLFLMLGRERVPCCRIRYIDYRRFRGPQIHLKTDFALRHSGWATRCAHPT